MARAIVDVGEIIDRSRFSPRQMSVVALCGILMILDGYDSGEIAFVGPSLIRDWHLQPSMLTLLFTANGITQIIASLFFGPVADRYGRRWLMIGGAALAGLMSLISAYAVGPSDFLIWRILCSLCLAAVMTNAIALGAEYAPARARSFAVIVLYCGFAVGQAIGAGVSAELIPTHGWQIVLIIGGVLPMIFAACCIPWLPESIRFLVLRQPKNPVIARELNKIDKHHSWGADTIFVSTEKAATARPIRDLFTEGRAAATVLVWLVFLMNITGVIFLNSWVPTLLHNADVPLAQALRAAMVMQVGTIIGALFMAWCMDRWGAGRILVPAHLLGVIGIALFGQTIGAGGIMFVVAALMGAGVQGAQTAMIGFTAGLYPTAIRATGIGSAFGVGRIGTILGPLFGGTVISLALPVGDAFLIGAMPAVVSSIGIIALSMVMRSGASRGTAGVTAETANQS